MNNKNNHHGYRFEFTKPFGYFYSNILWNIVDIMKIQFNTW